MGLIIYNDIFIIQVTFWDLIAYSAAGASLKLRRACTICDGPAGDMLGTYIAGSRKKKEQLILS